MGRRTLPLLIPETGSVLMKAGTLGAAGARRRLAAPSFERGMYRMTVMTKSAFKTLTHKYFSIRNGAISVIDDKLGIVNGDPTNRQKLLDLKKAILDFQNEKNAKHG